METYSSACAYETNTRRQERAIRNERFVGECLKRIHSTADSEEGLRRLLQYLGETLQCERVYVFEEIDRQHLCNTYEWCGKGVSSGIEELPYVSKNDLSPWYGRLAEGGSVIEPNVAGLRQSDPFIYEFLQRQQIHSIVLCPLMDRGKMVGLFGADNPPPENMEHISGLFDVLAYFVSSLVSRRELQKLREVRRSAPSHEASPPRFAGKTVLLVDDSPELLRLNERILRPEGYTLQSARTLKEAGELLIMSKPDAIVLDVDLPDGSGLDFCRELHQTQDIPVVFLTARSDEQMAKAGIQAGGCAYLTKPYQLEELRCAVGAAIGN